MVSDSSFEVVNADTVWSNRLHVEYMHSNTYAQLEENTALDCCFMAVLSLGRPLAQYYFRLEQQHVKHDVPNDEAPIDYEIKVARGDGDWQAPIIVTVRQSLDTSPATTDRKRRATNDSPEPKPKKMPSKQNTVASSQREQHREQSWEPSSSSVQSGPPSSSWQESWQPSSSWQESWLPSSSWQESWQPSSPAVQSWHFISSWQQSVQPTASWEASSWS